MSTARLSLRGPQSGEEVCGRFIPSNRESSVALESALLASRATRCYQVLASNVVDPGKQLGRKPSVMSESRTDQKVKGGRQLTFLVWTPLSGILIRLTLELEF
jgi:hypothetical protein